uniref:Uncharacterized protein n=1 Tax=Noctiluca scintillans TaxID=2966 RepID=A0A7S1A7Y9_NOCSC
MSLEASPKTFHFKLVLLGDTSVGKSCLVVRFAKGEFYEYQEPTIGAAFLTHSVNLEDDVVVKFELWDTAGQERYRSLAPMYYRGAAATLIVYDITSKESYQAAQQLVVELQQTETLVGLAGNKADLAESRRVEREVAEAYAQEMGAVFMETSAKSGENVVEIFEEIGRRLLRRSTEEQRKMGFQVGSNGNNASSPESCC